MRGQEGVPLSRQEDPVGRGGVGTLGRCPPVLSPTCTHCIVGGDNRI